MSLKSENIFVGNSAIKPCALSVVCSSQYWTICKNKCLLKRPSIGGWGNNHLQPSCGQKGSGESGYLGAPAAISSALNDAVRPLGITIAKLPIRAAALSDAIAAVRQASNP
jgi:hypothetical protein